MNSLKRIFFTMKAQLDHVADDFENHETIAGVAIRELEDYQGKTRIHRHRLQQMIEEFEAKLSGLNEQAETWSARAVKLKGQDKQKALECVRRMVQTKQQIKQLEPHLAKTREQFTQLTADLTAIEAQLQSLHTQKEMLSARQNRIHLTTSMQSGQGNPAGSVQAIFKRWEQTVVGAELSDPFPPDKDSFADEFKQEESELELKLLLDELTSK